MRKRKMGGKKNSIKYNHAPVIGCIVGTDPVKQVAYRQQKILKSPAHLTTLDYAKKMQNNVTIFATYEPIFGVTAMPKIK